MDPGWCSKEREYNAGMQKLNLEMHERKKQIEVTSDQYNHFLQHLLRRPFSRMPTHWRSFQVEAKQRKLQEQIEAKQRKLQEAADRKVTVPIPNEPHAPRRLIGSGSSLAETVFRPPQQPRRARKRGSEKWRHRDCKRRYGHAISNTHARAMSAISNGRPLTRTHAYTRARTHTRTYTHTNGAFLSV